MANPTNPNQPASRAPAPAAAAQDEETLIQVNPDVRVERTFQVDENGQYKWKVYQRKHTGVEYHEEHSKALKSGGGRDENGNVPHTAVKKFGAHPVIKDKDGNNVETTEEYVYVPAGEFASKDEAMKKAQSMGHGGTKH